MHSHTLTRYLSNQLWSKVHRTAYITQSRAFTTNHLLNQSAVKMTSPKFKVADRLAGTDKNVWVEFSQLAVEYQALNLGQGFPDFQPPEYVRQSLADATMSDNALMHQYTRSYGHPRFVKALANTFSPILQRDIDPMNEIIVTVGAYGSLFCAIQGLINPGDEVIIIEPYFDCYEPMVTVAGGKPVFIPLRQTRTGSDISSADFKLDAAELESKFTSKTKAILFNNPNNPLGKVYDRDEMTMIADLCKKHDVLVISDDVYEWIVYPDNTLIKMATLPDMWERTITIGSAGKTFSATGWKVGWTIGPHALVHALQLVHQNCNYTVPTPLQEALAIGFETEQARFGAADCYFTSLAEESVPKRDMLAGMLRDVGMTPIIPQGSYFMIADFSQLGKFEGAENEPDDYKFVKWMTRNKRLTAIPPSAFYSAEHKHLAENLVRFCFIKKDETLEKAREIFQNWNK